MDSALSVYVRPCVRVLLGVLLMCSARATNAQEGSELFSFDFGIGPAIGSGRGEALERAGAGYAINLSWRFAAIPKRRAILALNSAGFYLPFEENVGCLLVVNDADTPTACPAFKAPDAISLGILGGVALGPDASAFRFMAGPALFRARQQDNAIGLQSRIDVSRPITQAVSFVAWAQGMLMPMSTEDANAKAIIFGVGLRLR